MNGHVYIIEREDGKVKIGKSINPKRRINALRNQGGFKIINQHIGDKCSNYSDMEYSMHNLFKEHREIGEWFGVSFELAKSEFLKMSLNEVGDKDTDIKESGKKHNKITSEKCDLINVFREMFIKDASKGFEEIQYEINLESWELSDDDIEKAKIDIEEMATSLIEDCNEPENVEEYKNMINIISTSDNGEEIKKIIQGFYIEMYDAVPSDYLEKCYGKEEKDFIFKVLGIKEVVKNPMEERLRKGWKEPYEQA